MKIYKGNTKRYKFTLTVGGVAVNLTGMSLKFTVKKNENDTYDEALIKKVVTVHTAPLSGESEITLYSADTSLGVGNYFVYITLVDSAGEPVTFKKDSLTIMPSEK